MSDPLSALLGGSTSPASTSTPSDPLSSMFSGATAQPTPNAGTADPLSQMFQGTSSSASATDPLSGMFSNSPAQTDYQAGTDPATGAAYAATPAASGNPSLPHQVFNAIGKLASGVGSVAGEFAKETVHIPVQAGLDVYNDVTKGGYVRNGQVTGGGLGPTEAQWKQSVAQNPILGGMVQGLGTTASELADPYRLATGGKSKIAANYSANPVQAALNDLGSLATVLPGVGEAIHGVAIGGATTDAALTAAKAGDLTEGSLAAARAAKVGDIIKAIGEAPSLPLRGARAGLLALAKGVASDPEILHLADAAVTTAATEAGRGAPALYEQAGLSQSAQAYQDAANKAAEAFGKVAPFPDRLAATAQDAALAETSAARDAAQSALANRSGMGKALGALGARLSPDTQTALNISENGMSKIRDIAGDASMSQTEKAAAKIAATDSTVQRLIHSPLVERINEVDLASLEAAAKEQNTSLTSYLKSIGFTSLDEATSGRFGYPNAYVSNQVAEQLGRYTAIAKEPGVTLTALKGANRLAMVSKLGLNPLTVVNRIGHGVLGIAANPEIRESYRLAAKDLLSKVHIGEGLSAADLDKLSETTLTKHGAVWQASAKAAAEDSGRLQAIKQGLADAPANILAKSPFLRAARAVDDSVRSGIWLAARNAGATADEADLILGRAAGYFDRSTELQRGISGAIPFFNWHKQVLQVFEHMAEMHPAAFAQFTNAAMRMSQYNQANGIYGSNTRIGGVDTNLSFLSPFSALGADATPGSLLSPALKGGLALTGHKPNLDTVSQSPGSPKPSFPDTGAAGQELINVLPQGKAIQQLINPAPRYGNGQIVANAPNATPMQIWSSLLGVPTESSATAIATNNSVAKAKAASDKINASRQKSYQKKLAANGR